MKILYFYQYFSTSEGSWGTRVHEFASSWVAARHDVTVVTAVYSKSDLRPSHLVTHQKIDGINVIVVNVPINNKQPVLGRVFTFLLYAFISSWYALTLRADIVVASSGPITVGIPGLVARWFRGRKLVFEARDLWPEGAIRLGVIRNPLIVRLSYWFEKLCYLNSEAIIGLSVGIQDDIKKRFPTCRVASVTNAVNTDLFCKPAPVTNELVAGGYAVYFGNIGVVNHSGYLLDVARELLARGRADIQIVLIGEGQLKDSLKQRKETEKLSNVVFFDLMPKSKLVGYVQNSLASLVPLKPVPVFDTSSPNKLFEAMAAGRPVIQTTQGWIRALLEENSAGFTVNGDRPTELVDLLIHLRDDPSFASEIGGRGQELAKRLFDKNILAAKMLSILESAHAA